MALKSRHSIVLALLLLILYIMFWKSDEPSSGGSHTIDVLKGVGKDDGYGQTPEYKAPINNDPVQAPGTALEEPEVKANPGPYDAATELEEPKKEEVTAVVEVDANVEVVSTTSVTPHTQTTWVADGKDGSGDTWVDVDAESTRTNFFVPEATGVAEEAEEFSPEEDLSVESTSTNLAVPAATGIADDGATLQAHFDKDYDALGLLETAGAIYGSTLRHLVGAGTHAGSHAAALTPTESWTPYSNTPPNTFNPYPDYNSTAWAASNVGKYVQCEGPDGLIEDMKVFSGHPKAFEDSVVGSYVPFNLDSNLCFERETRLGAYGFKGEGSVGQHAAANPATKPAAKVVEKRTNWDNVNWRDLQEACVKLNSNRYASAKAAVETTQETTRDYNGQAISNSTTVDNSTVAKEYNTQKLTDSPTVDNSTVVRRQVIADEKTLEEDPAETPKVKVLPKSRTAVLLRASSSKKYTENEIQNIRSLISELALRSGGEYTVYLMVEVESNSAPIWSNGREYATKAGIPPEFESMCIFWNEAMMKKGYFRTAGTENATVSSWLPVQKFSADFPQYEYLWNWELDTRYTGHHYNLFDKLIRFGLAQPRKGIWERNERFFIPSVHGGYDTVYRAQVQQLSGKNTIWGAPKVRGVKPVGPVKASLDPADDNYAWGVGEETDYLSLSPIFNPMDTTWPNSTQLWGYVGDATPRRASIGTNSRISAKLLKTMDYESMRGNHLGSEMGPSTVSLLHGLKAVYAPVPTYFDRAWTGNRLNAYLNPGPKGVSGSCPDSPWSEGNEVRFEGSTWGEKAVVPRRLYNAWLGWEFRGYGGPKWEKAHGRICLPPLLLRPINDVVEPAPDHAS